MHNFSTLQISRLVYRSYLKNVRLCSHYTLSKRTSPLTSNLIQINTTSSSRKNSTHSTFESVVIFQHKIFKKISDSAPVEVAQNFLLNFHDYTGLSWWATIIITTCILRASITVPLAIYQNYIMAKVEKISLEMNDIIEELKQETAMAIKMYNWDLKTARITYNRSMKKQWNKLIVRDNCHPFKASILLWIQLPTWICVSVSYRNLVYMLPKNDADAFVTFTELSIGGLAWIPNLTFPDASWILPIALGLLNLSIIEIQVMSKMKKTTKIQSYLTNFFRFVSVILVPIAATVPSCLSMYWATSSCFGLVQNLVLLSPKVRRFVGIPHTPSEVEHPYKLLWNKIKDRISVIPGIKSSW